MAFATRSIAAITRWRHRRGMATGEGGDQKVVDQCQQMSATPGDSQHGQGETHDNEITYVPTSVLKSALSENRKYGGGGGTMLDQDGNAVDEREEQVNGK